MGQTDAARLWCSSGESGNHHSDLRVVNDPVRRRGTGHHTVGGRVRLNILAAASTATASDGVFLVANESMDPYLQIIIVWKDEADRRQRLLAIVEEQHIEFLRAVASWQQSGQVLTTAESATLKPRLKIVARDERADSIDSVTCRTGK